MVTRLTFATFVLTTLLAWPSSAAADWLNGQSTPHSGRALYAWAEPQVAQWGSEISSVDSFTPSRVADAGSLLSHVSPRTSRLGQTLNRLVGSPRSLDDEGSIVRTVSRWWWVALALWGVQTWVTGRVSFNPWG